MRIAIPRGPSTVTSLDLMVTLTMEGEKSVTGFLCSTIVLMHHRSPTNGNTQYPRYRPVSWTLG